MFGFVAANPDSLSAEQKRRYNAVYCGICRQIRIRSGKLPALGLSYDMAFLALLLMSLYEPEETSGPNACLAHPIRKSPWVDSACIRYAADMNVALAYYKARDDWQDDRSLPAGALSAVLGRHLESIAAAYPRQTKAISDCIAEIAALEGENCDNPDLPANAFGTLMGELLVYREDHWARTLRAMGMALGRFIYLADAAVDYGQDEKKKKYNPFLAMGTGHAPKLWEEYLVMAMATCTQEFEKLPLVQDKPLLDHILYSGVWCGMGKGKEKKHDK